MKVARVIFIVYLVFIALILVGAFWFAAAGR